MSQFVRIARFTAAGLAALSLSFEAVAAPGEASAGQSLYQRLGGKRALTAVVNELWAQVSADARIEARFAQTKPEVFGGLLVEFLCEASGGPCKYQGKDMKTAHAGMKLSDAEFTALAEDTAKALDKFEVPAAEKGEVLAMLGGLKGDVVGR